MDPRVGKMLPGYLYTVDNLRFIGTLTEKVPPVCPRSTMIDDDIGYRSPCIGVYSKAATILTIVNINVTSLLLI